MSGPRRSIGTNAASMPRERLQFDRCVPRTFIGAFPGRSPTPSRRDPAPDTFRHDERREDQWCEHRDEVDLMAADKKAAPRKTPAAGSARSKAAAPATRTTRSVVANAATATKATETATTSTGTPGGRALGGREPRGRGAGGYGAGGYGAGGYVVSGRIPIAATVFREGHDALGVNVVLRDSAGRPGPWTPMRLVAPGTDRYEAVVTADAPGAWTFQIEAWGDPLESWRHDARIKIPEGQDVELMLEEGARLHEQAAASLASNEGSTNGHIGGTSYIGGTSASDEAGDAGRLLSVAETLRSPGDPVERLSSALARGVLSLLARHPLRTLLTVSTAYPLWVDRERALFGSWYEFFPRSEGASLDPPRSGTFASAALRLPAIAEMGFDVVYIPPVHPIGTTFRKGPNNTLTPGPGDPGVPWAIGSSEGGHDSIHPDLGTMDDFDAFVATAKSTVGDPASGVVHHPRRRQHRLRGESAEEVPRHLPAELRQRLRGSVRRNRAGRSVVDEPRSSDLPGRQPAHQAGPVLGRTTQRHPRDRPGRVVLGGGVYEAGHDARAGEGRLPSVVHLLHLAQYQAGTRALPHRALARDL
jgi:hypothetical protein